MTSVHIIISHENPEDVDLGVFNVLVIALISIQPLADIIYNYTCYDRDY